MMAHELTQVCKYTRGMVALVPEQALRWDRAHVGGVDRDAWLTPGQVFKQMSEVFAVRPSEAVGGA
ncbi:hypothetical protein ADK55_12125 [Streptomyces sp. WM4235]|nr:hypothetical protein ADK55_12125 [Streptomyces sp. WM4235]